MRTGTEPSCRVPQAEDPPEGMLPVSRDGRMLFCLMVILLFSPYLPQIGPIEGRFRFDSLALPLFAFYMVWREARSGALRVVPAVVAYAAFVGWLFLVSGNILVTPVAKYGSLGTDPTYEKATHFIDFLSGIEMYLRPLFVLLVATKARIPTEDLIRILKSIVLLGAPLFLIGLLQLIPFTRTITTDLVYILYTNQREGAALGLKYVLGGGRAMSIFGQVGTFGQFSILVLGILGIHRYGGKIISSGRARMFLLILAVLGGIGSGSKVFTGGVLMLIVLMGLPLYVIRRPKLAVGLVALAIVIGTLVTTILSDYAVGRIITFWFALPDLVETYGAGRFYGGQGVAPKIVRTLALNIVADFPLTGLGLPVIARTVDSYWIGITVMTGVLGLSLYLFFLGVVVRRLRWIDRSHADPSISAAAKMMIFLTLIFAAAAIGFPTFIQDRVGDLYWLIVGLLISPFLDSRRVGDAGVQR